MRKIITSSILFLLLVSLMFVTSCWFSSQNSNTSIASNDTQTVALDSDADTVQDLLDNCPLIANTNQTDLDQDRIGDACDTSNSLVKTAQAARIMEKVISYSATNKFEIRNNDEDLKGESIYDVTNALKGEDVAWLEDGKISTPLGSSSYSQYLNFSSQDPLNHAVFFGTNQDQKIGDFYVIRKHQNIAQYHLEFMDGLESRISGRGDFFIDLLDQNIVLMGKRYTIVNAYRPTGLNSVHLVLMHSPTQQRVSAQPETFSVGEKTYTISLLKSNSEGVILSINGKTTPLLHRGDLTLLEANSQGNSYLGVGSFQTQGEFNYADVYLGAQKIVLQDDLIKDLDDGGTLIVNDNPQKFSTVKVSGNINGQELTISTIDIDMRAEKEIYIPAHGTLSEGLEIAQIDPAILFTQNWDIAYDGLSDVPTHKITLAPTSPERYELTWYEGTGKQVRMPLFEFKIRGLLLGGHNQPLILRERSDIPYNSNVVVTTGHPEQNNARSYLMRYNGWNASTKEVSFTHVALNKTYVGSADEKGNYILNVGGANFIVNIQELNGGTDSKVKVDLNGDGDFFDNVSIVDEYGLTISLEDVEEIFPNDLKDEYHLHLTSPNPVKFDNVVPTPLTIDIKNTGGAVGAAIRGYNLVFEPRTFHSSHGYSSLGTFISLKANPGLAHEINLDYPQSQRYPVVRVVGYLDDAKAK
ncbi:thrombospondin type 3 repeat-containing protein [Candidatus Woesearchaeota archaeon]|nr:thrombospondin type 3 repeat-containing protein [Candidatus Woesearchaeota archaeon]